MLDRKAETSRVTKTTEEKTRYWGKTWDDAESFIDFAQEFLHQNEAQNGLIIGVAQRYAQKKPNDDVKRRFFLIFKGEQPILAAFRTPPFGLSVTPLYYPQAIELEEEVIILEEVTSVLSDLVAKAYENIPSLNGAKVVVESFVKQWFLKTKSQGQFSLPMRLHRLNEVANLSLPQGVFKQATQKDAQLIHQWLVEFQVETLGEHPPSLEEITTGLSTADPRFYLWYVDEQPVSMAAWSRPTKTGVSVNAVYTPKNLRGHGYATAVVHQLSTLLLNRGFLFCILYTDMTNPISNSIYAKIGYKGILDTCLYKFDA